MDFLQFKQEYINTLRTYLTLDAEKHRTVGGQRCRAKLADLAEYNPSWVEIIEDQLAKNHHLQN